MKIKILLSLVALMFCFATFSQTLYVPGGTSGIGDNTYNGNIAIPNGKFINLNGPSDLNWRIGLDNPTISDDYNITIQGASTSASPNRRFRIKNYTGSELFNVNFYTGSVGINVSNPNTVFQVGPNTSWNSSTESVGGDFRITGYSAATPYAFVQARDNSGTNSIGLILRTQNSGSINNAFFIMPSGNVGIGCSNPTVKLAVSGKIQATEVEIKSAPCSDFVFEKDYKLTSLSDLEKFVTVNKHLPEVPSAKEFEENGYSVGQLDDLLLRKVEELTLYVIEQNKKIEILQQENKELLKSVNNK